MKSYIGIDIGLHGAIVFNQEPITIYKMPLIKKVLDIDEINAIFKMIKNSHVTYENLNVIFGSSKATAFSMGYQSGVIEAFCKAYELPYTKVNAKEWQKEMFKGIPEISLPPSKGSLKGKRDTKAMALIAVKRLFPNVQLTMGKETKPNDGIVDALLISEYAKRMNL